MLHYILCNMKRKKRRGMVTVGVSIFLVLLLNLYFENIRSYRQQLEDLSKNIPVFCRVTDASGSSDNDIAIPAEIVDVLQNSVYVKELSLSHWLAAGIEDFPMEEWKAHTIYFPVGVNRVEAVPGMEADNISLSEEEQKEFFGTDERVCIVDESAMKENEWEIGDVVPLNLIRYIYTTHEIRSEMMGVEEFKIIGTMDEMFAATAGIYPDMLLPLGTVRDILSRKQVPFTANSASFYVADPLNLDAFKEEMKAAGMAEQSADSMFSYTGNALSVDDEMFVSFANHLRQSIDILNAFFPIICAVVLIIGYVVSYLLCSSRQWEFALFRAIGQHTHEVVRMFWTEQFFLALAGNAAGSLAALLFAGNLSVALTVNGVVLVSYLIGCAAALWRMGRRNAMQLLFMQN
ncbi:MAG: ABC transporter permease [Eubacteriales bacterium]|nr:ABC transporter permease [Eubacteriales bacterium]